MPKNYQKLSLLNSILFGTDVLALISAKVQHCRRKKTISNSATNHQTLTLMKNLFFGTVVLAINSAEKHHCRRKKDKVEQCPKIIKSCHC